jgi:Peptidase family C25
VLKNVEVTSLVGLRALVGLLCASSVVSAGIAGVPTALNADGSTSASSVNPPGWLEGFGPTQANTAGDPTHQQRYLIEVTASTLDVLVFDPGTSGSRDGLAGAADTSTTFALFSPSGASLASIAIVADVASGANITDNRLVRLTPSGFQTLNSTAGTNVNFSGLTPGVYELRVTQTAGNDGNFYGIDVRVSRTGLAHYNVYTIGTDNAPASGYISGSNTTTGAPGSGITGPVSVFPWVNRGCGLESSNYDGDSTGTASLFDAVGASTAIAASGDGTRLDTSHVIESTAAQNVSVDNYGLWELRFSPGATNGVNWRFADFTGWANNPANNLLRNPNSSVRMYFPNGYSPTASSNGAVRPTKPVLRLGAVVASGSNPPAVGTTTRYVLSAALKNGTALALSGAQITVGLPAGVTFFGAQTCLLNGTVSACSDSSAAGFRRVTLASVPAGQTATLRFEVTVTPAAAGLLNLTGAPVAGATPPNSTAWASYTQFNTTETVGPLCQMRINVGGTVALPTAARLLTSAFDSSTRTLSFETSYQRGTDHFELYAFDRAATGAQSAVRIATVHAALPDSVIPQHYQLQLDDDSVKTVAIDEIDLDGSRQRLGIIDLTDATKRAVAPVQPLAISPVGDRPMAQAEKALVWRSTNALKLLLGASGRFEVSRQVLESAGLPFGTRTVALTHQGKPLHARWNDDETKLQFETPPFHGRYARFDAVLLTWEHRAAPAMRVPLSQLKSSKPASVSVAEKDRLYVPSSGASEDPWWWALLRSNAPFPPSNDVSLGEFDLPGIALQSGPIAVRLFAKGRSQHLHTLRFSINGVDVGGATAEGKDDLIAQGTIDARQLYPLKNALTVRLEATETPYTPSHAFGLAYLGHLEFDFAPKPSETVYQPVEVVGLKYLKVSPTDYLIITHSRFLAAAQRFAVLKEREGFRPQVVDVEAIYDAFSGGIVEARAIARYIQHVAASHDLRYVMLWGDDTFDPKDFLGLHAESLIPSLDEFDESFGRIPADASYVDVDADGSPDLPIGRLPVQTAAEAEAYVDKVSRAHSSAPLPHTFVADEASEGDANFSDIAAGALPLANGRYLFPDNGIDSLRVPLVESFANLTGVLHYFGHGSPTSWSSSGRLFTADEASRLVASPQRSGAVVFQWNCLAHWYQYLYGPSLGESLLRVSGGGALASVGPVGISSPEGQSQLRQVLYTSFFERGRSLGESLLRAQRLGLKGTKAQQDAARGFQLFGDPSFRLEPQQRETGTSDPLIGNATWFESAPSGR